MQKLILLHLTVACTACLNSAELEVAPNLNTVKILFHCDLAFSHYLNQIKLAHDRGEKLHSHDHSGQDYAHLGLSAHHKF